MDTSAVRTRKFSTRQLEAPHGWENLVRVHTQHRDWAQVPSRPWQTQSPGQAWIWGLSWIVGERENPQKPEHFLMKHDCPASEPVRSGARGKERGTVATPRCAAAELGQAPRPSQLRRALPAVGKAIYARYRLAISLTPFPLSRLHGHRVVKHVEDLVKGQPWFIGLSAGWEIAPGLRGPKAGWFGRDGERGEGDGGSGKRQRLQGSARTFLRHHLQPPSWSHLDAGGSGTSPSPERGPLSHLSFQWGGLASLSRGPPSSVPFWPPLPLDVHFLAVF